MKRLALALLAVALLWAIPQAARSAYQKIDQVSFSNISATTAAFSLRGGRYGVEVHATFGGGSVTLQRLAADGVTWITAMTAFSADGYASADLSSGSYRLTVVTATGIYADITATDVPL
jgi:hypothetical protein